jgi:hypothetical protein
MKPRRLLLTVSLLSPGPAAINLSRYPASK